jgi:septin 3/9/12
LTPARERIIQDTRVHAVVYFIFPSGHGLSPLDVLAMKHISEVCNLIPVIAKSDALTLEERSQFKLRVKEELKAHNISVYPDIYGLELDVVDPAEQQINDQVMVTFFFQV